MKPFGAFLAAWILLVPPVGSPQGKSEATSHDWPVYAGNAENTQHSALAEINRDNVKQLRVAWTIDTGDPWVPQPRRQSPASTAPQRANSAARLDAAERQRVIDQAIANLKRFYFDRKVAQKTADALRAHEKNGDDDAATQGEAFAGLVTAQMRDASHDMHLIMEYSQDPLPEGPPAETAESRERYRKAMLAAELHVQEG